MPRRTKSELEEENDFLKRDVRNLSAELAELRRRERSPRRLSASTSHARLSATCKALNQVRRWERDATLEERDAKITELLAMVEKQKEEITSLRRGEGPIGEVLLANWPPSTLYPDTRERLLAQTWPVNVTIKRMGDLLDGLRQVALYGDIPLPREADACREAVSDFHERYRGYTRM
jgi:hypothetical protein